MIIPLDSKLWRATTPFELFCALAGDPELFWLEFGAPSDGWSYVGAAPSSPHNIEQSILHTAIGNQCKSSNMGIFPLFSGGWIVRLNYPGAPAAAVEISARHYPLVLAFSHSQKIWYAVFSPGAGGGSALSALLGGLEHKLNSRLAWPHRAASKVYIYLNRERYICSIIRALSYIAAGDIYQINLAQKFTAPWAGLPEELHAALRAQGPGTWGAYLGAAFSSCGEALCCVSPELFLRVSGGRVETRPIKGTRARGEDAAAMTRAARELDESPKERAELNMIVDLERNDLGRICNYGTVRVDSAGSVQVLPGLLHRSAVVSGELRTGVNFAELLAATFPGGSITGAPKLRAMQLIAELEAAPRGAYCGAIGWLGFDGALEMNIAIRTAAVHAASAQASYFAGAGIVADSDPEREYEESLLKARPFLNAVNAEIRIHD